MRNKILKNLGWVCVTIGFLTIMGSIVNLGMQFFWATIVLWVLGFGILQINHRLNKAAELSNLLARSAKRGVQTQD
tara:strand:+ start:1590 stop:1817 length:228 start_codon:yes stop_codon:yes gene_type:complete